jgi:hypothetical protein
MNVPTGMESITLSDVRSLGQGNPKQARLLLLGPKGTGKSTIINAFCKKYGIQTGIDGDVARVLACRLSATLSASLADTEQLIDFVEIDEKNLVWVDNFEKNFEHFAICFKAITRNCLVYTGSGAKISHPSDLVIQLIPSNYEDYMKAFHKRNMLRISWGKKSQDFPGLFAFIPLPQANFVVPVSHDGWEAHNKTFATLEMLAGSGRDILKFNKEAETPQ